MTTALPFMTPESKASPRRSSRRKRLRTLWLTVHRYLGLSLGAVLALIGLTGSILVFFKELDAQLNSALMTVNSPLEGDTRYRAWADLASAAEAAKPHGGVLSAIYFPRHETAACTFSYKLTRGEPEVLDIHEVFVDPYTARVLGARVAYRSASLLPPTFISFIFELHYALLLHETGVTLVGILALFLMLSLITGLLLWWPLTVKPLKAFTIKRGAGAHRFTFDLHKTFGVYSLLVLAAVLLSGVSMNLPTAFAAVVTFFSPATRTDVAEIHSTPASSAPIDVAQAVAIVEQHSPAGQLNWLSAPDGKEGVYVISKRDVPELSSYWSERQITLDQYSGRILNIRDPTSRRTAGETFLDWQWPLHSGQAFGWTGRILVFLSGLSCPVLYVTGLLLWLKRRRAVRFRAEHVKHFREGLP